jgi:hypothetical protein
MSKAPKPEKPRSEPEIIPPGHAGRGFEGMRIHIGKPSPLGLILVTLIIGILSAAILVLLFSAFLFLVPLIVLFATGALVVGLLRFYFRGLWG